jgi:hypothetical protein
MTWNNAPHHHIKKFDFFPRIMESHIAFLSCSEKILNFLLFLFLFFNLIYKKVLTTFAMIYMFVKLHLYKIC